MTEQSLKTISKSNRDLKCTQALIMGGGHFGNNSNSNSNWTFIALNLPKQEDSKVQQNKKQSTKFCVQGHNRGRTPRRTPGG